MRVSLDTTNKSIEIGTVLFFSALPRPIVPEEAWLGLVWRLPYDADPEPHFPHRGVGIEGASH